MTVIYRVCPTKTFQLLSSFNSWDYDKQELLVCIHLQLEIYCLMSIHLLLEVYCLSQWSLSTLEALDAQVNKSW